MNLTGNAGYVLLMLLSGWCMGMAFDFYTTVAKSTKVVRPLRPLFDVLFWIASAICVYYITFVTIQGEFRVYTFLLLGVGYGIYRALFRRVVVGSALLVVRMIRITLRVVGRLVYTVIGLPLVMLFKVVLALCRGFYRVTRSIEDIVCRTLSLVFAVLVFPFRRFLHADTAWRKKLQEYEKVFWDALSNLLRKKPRSVS